ncbi:hypothetical protein B0T10DRAFT_590098 [Thelonectria olida]|uniref:Uncharacterized protein n=1 Tax=Thelonectria olida TaxID=1576542 RepID=A0A9P8WB10_9HYPO|nr:hypothetical protein B0T10DRAFT_590098 [Thelonectria olida]
MSSPRPFPLRQEAGHKPLLFSQRPRNHRPPDIYVEWSNFLSFYSPTVEWVQDETFFSPLLSPSLSTSPPIPAPSPPPIPARKRPHIASPKKPHLKIQIPSQTKGTAKIHPKTPYPSVGLQSPSGPRATHQPADHTPRQRSEEPTKPHERDNPDSETSVKDFFMKLGKIVGIFLVFQLARAMGSVLSLLTGVAIAVNAMLLFTAG